MQIRVDGIVERYAPSLAGHGDHEFSVLLVGRKTVFSFPGVRQAYSDAIGRPSGTSSTLVELMAPGDHISFEIEGDQKQENFFKKVASNSLRNWTLEHRLIGKEIDVTDQSEILKSSEGLIPPIVPKLDNH